MSNRRRTRQSDLLPLRYFKLSLSRSVAVPLGLALAASAAVPAYAQDGSNGGHAAPTTGGTGGAGSDAFNGGGGGGSYTPPGVSVDSASGSGLGSSWGGGGRSSSRGLGGSSTGGGRGADGEAYPAWAGGGGGGAGGGLNSAGMGGGGGGGAAHGAEGGAAGGGGGGGGRLGLNIVASGASNSGTIAGGNGGDGGNGAVGPAVNLGNSSGGGGGGGGGSGVLVAAGLTYTNQGLITGGSGGFGGDGPENGSFHLGGGGGGGGGGAGILLGDGATFINSGSVAGGDGGNAVVFGGQGGAGIYAAGNVTITNSGTISGGLNGNSPSGAIAMQFAGTDNSLILTTGSVINGQINLSGSGTTTIVAQNAGLQIGGVAIDYEGTLELSLLEDFAITGPVGGGGSLTASGAGQLSLDRVSFTGAIDLMNTGGVVLNGAIAAAAGHTYGSAVVLANDLTLQSDSGSVSFASTVDGAHALAVIAAGGTIQFNGAVGSASALTSLTMSSATLTASGPITAGQLSITTTAGPISQGAAFSVAGSATFDAQSNDIVLANAGNSFGGTVALAGRNVAVTNSSALQLATSSIGGTFSATMASISQTGAINVAGATTLDAGSGDISLVDAANSFGGAIAATGGNIAIRGGSSLQFDQLNHAANGNISIVAGGTLTLPGSIGTTGTLLLAADGGALATSGSLAGSTVTLRGRDGLLLAHDIGASGGLDISSTAGNITQTSGVIAGLVQGAAAGDVSLTSVNMIDTLGDFTAGGDFTLSNGRALTISGTLAADGVNLDAGSGIVVTGAVQSSGLLNITSGTDLRVGNGGTAGSITAATVALAGTLTYDRADTASFDDILTGSGGFVQEGAGNLLFDGDGSAFAGETEVRSGTLIVGGAAGSSAVLGGYVRVMSGAVLGGHGTLADNVELADGATLAPGNSIGTLAVQGNLTLDQGSRLAFEVGSPGASFSIPGSSDSVQVGGDLSLNGATLDVIDADGMGPGLYRVFSYGGTLTQSNGGLTLGAVPVGSELQLQFLTGDRQINLLNVAGTTLNFWNANGLADAARLGGGSGAWSLAAQNWTDAEGSVTASMQPVPGFAIFGGDAGTVMVDDIDGPVSASGLQFASTGYVLDGDPLHLVSSSGETPVIRVGDGSAAEAGYVATIHAPLSGSDGFVKQGLGVLILGGDSAAHSGVARAEAGTLLVNGRLGGMLEVVSGARVGGNGAIGALAVASGGTLAPGNSIGTLSVGSLNLASGSILEVEVDAAGNADRVNASGAVTIDGASMSVLAAQGDYAPFTSYTVLTSQGGITGTFANVTSDLAFLTPTLSYDSGSVVLNLTRNDIAFGDVARTPNQRAVAGAASTLSPTNDLFNALVGQDAAGARAAFDQLSGEIHPSVRTVLVEDGRLPREAVLDRLAWAGEGSGSWGRVFGNWGKSDGDGNAADTRRKTGGLVMGVDIGTPGNLRFGLAGGYTRTDVEVDARLSEAKVKSGHVLAYAGAHFDALGMRLGLGYSRSDVEADRSVAIGSLNDQLEASYDGELLQAFGEVAYSLPLGGGTVSPFAGVSVVDVRTEGFIERGGPATLSVAKTDETITSSTLGLRAETAGMGPISLRVTGGWQRVWGGHVPASTVMLAGATTPAVIAGVPLSRNSGIAEADVVWRLGAAATLTAGYAGRLGGNAQDHAARATLTIAF